MKTKTIATTLMLATVLCLSLAAFGQTIINFNGLPQTGAPLPIPNGYAGMNWGNFDYITEQLKTGIQNVAFPAFTGPGPTAETMSAVNPGTPYTLEGMVVSGQYGSTLTLYGYNNGVFAGSKSYPLAPVLTPIRVPPEWGPITQTTFVCVDSSYHPAIFNLFNLTLQ